MKVGSEHRARRGLWVAVGAVVGACSVAVGTWAAIPHSATDVITACVVRSGADQGAVRIIDAQGGSRCRASERTLTWQSRGLKFRGQWAAGQRYQRDDVVTRQGSSFVATADSTGSDPTSNSNAWAVLASRGPAGPRGATGATGQRGEPGPADIHAPVVTSLFTSEESGYNPSLTIGSNGVPVIAQKSHDGHLSIVTCGDLTCTSATDVDLDPTLTMNDFAVAVGLNGNPVVAYGASNFDLKIALCANRTCRGTSTVIKTLDSAGSVATALDLTVLPTGEPVVAYLDVTNDDLKIAACSDPQCTTATLTSVATTGMTGMDPAITVGANGFPIVAYSDANSQGLSVVACLNATCTDYDGSRIADAPGTALASIAIRPDGRPLIAYLGQTNTDIRVARCANETCTAATTGVLVSTPSDWFSLTMRADGTPIMSYYDDGDSALVVASCDDRDCTTSTSTVLDAEGIVGQANSIAVGVDGNPVIAYFDNSNRDLKVYACGNPLCNKYLVPGR